MKVFKKIALTAAVVAVSASAIGQDSPRAVEESLDQQIVATASSFAVVAKTPATASDGLQFRIAYDPNVVRVSNTSDCLMGMSKGMGDALVSCRHIAEKNLVQIAIADLSRQGLIPANVDVGIIEFETIGKRGSTGAAVWVEDVHVSGARNSSAEEAVAIETINY